MMVKYEPSHRVGPMTSVMAVPMIVVAVGAAWIYQWLIERIPLLYLDALLVIGLGFALGGATALALWVGKCRSPIVGALVGVLIACVAVAVSHYFAYQHSLAKSPGVTWSQYVDARVQVGWKLGRRSSGRSVSGFFVYLCWAIEAGACIVGGLIAGVSVARSPFCEHCNRWANKAEAEGTTRVAEETVVSNVSAAEDTVQLLDVPAQTAVMPAPPGARDLRYVLKGCPACEEVATLSVELIEHVTDKKGKPDTNTKWLHSNVLLNAAEAVIVKDLVARFGQPVEAAPKT